MLNQLYVEKIVQPLLTEDILGEPRVELLGPVAMDWGAHACSGDQVELYEMGCLGSHPQTCLPAARSGLRTKLPVAAGIGGSCTGRRGQGPTWCGRSMTRCGDGWACEYVCLAVQTRNKWCSTAVPCSVCNSSSPIPCPSPSWICSSPGAWHQCSYSAFGRLAGCWTCGPCVQSPSTGGRQQASTCRRSSAFLSTGV